MPTRSRRATSEVVRRFKRAWAANATTRQHTQLSFRLSAAHEQTTRPEMLTACHVVRRRWESAFAFQSSAFRNLVGLVLENGRGEIERHAQVNAVVMQTTGGGHRRQMSSVQISAVERVGDGPQTGREIGVESLRDRVRQKQTVAHRHTASVSALYIVPMSRGTGALAIGKEDGWRKLVPRHRFSMGMSEEREARSNASGDRTRCKPVNSSRFEHGPIDIEAGEPMSNAAFIVFAKSESL